MKPETLRARLKPLATVLPLYLLPALCLCWMAGLLLSRAAASAWPLAAALALSILGVAVLFPAGKGLRACSLCAAALCLAGVVGFHAWHPALPPLTDAETGLSEVTGVVAEEVRVSGTDTLHVRTVLRDVTVNGQPLRGGLYWTMYTDALPEALTPGQRVSAAGRLYAPNSADNPGGFDFREYLLQQRIPLGFYGGQDTVTAVPGPFSLWGAAAGLRHTLTLRLRAALGEDAGALAATMLLGVRSLVPEDDRAAFSRLGIAHILSVSGFHVGVLAGLLAAILRLLRADRRVRLAVETAVLAAYCLLTGLHAPVIRASILLIAGETGRLRNRRGHGLHLLALSALVTLIVFPTQLTSAGFHMTYAALLGLLCVAPALERRFPARPGPLGWVKRATISGAAAQAGVALPLMYWYQSLPLWAVVLSAPVTLFSAAFIALGWVHLALGLVPAVGPLIGQITAAAGELFLRGVRLLGALPVGNLWTARANLLTALGWVLLMAGCSVFLAMGRRKRAAMIGLGCLLMALSVVPLPHTGTDYIQLSVGSADAAVLHDRDTVVVIDTGEDGRVLSQYLRQRRLSVDTLVITHLHSDHVGGVQALLDERIPVRRCVYPDGGREAAVQPELTALLDSLADTGTEVQAMARGDTLALPSGSLTAVWPERSKVRPGQDANESSLALLARLGGASLLLTGDLDGRYEAYAALPADILKVAHHGSASSTSPAFLEAVAPQVMLLSCGDDRRPETLAERAGSIPIYSTRALGAVTVMFHENGIYTVTGYRE